MLRTLIVAAALAACGNSKTDSPPSGGSAKEPMKLEPIKQDTAFPVGKWVRTTLFDGKTPYIGFTYVDRMKGNSIKGEKVDGLEGDALKQKLAVKFPSSTMSPIPEGHKVTPLSEAEIKQLELPAEPEWLRHYK